MALLFSSAPFGWSFGNASPFHFQKRFSRSFCLSNLPFLIHKDNRNLSRRNLRVVNAEDTLNMGTEVQETSCLATCSSSDDMISDHKFEHSKSVWIWTESKEVMIAATERGWNKFLFIPQNEELAEEWAYASIDPLFIRSGEIFDSTNKRMGNIIQVASPGELLRLQPDNQQAENIVIELLDWQVIPAENIVAAFRGSQKTIFAISRTPTMAQLFLEVLQEGLGGVVLKVEDVKSVLDFKEYMDKRNEERSVLSLTKAIVTGIYIAGMGDRVCVDLCSLMRPGEGLLVGSFARGLFLVHSECLESNYIASRPFRVNAGPVHAYVAVPGGKTCYLSELKAGKEVIVIDEKGQRRIAIVGRVKIETRPLILVEAKIDSDVDTCYSVHLQNAETVALVGFNQESGSKTTAIPVTSLKLGDEVLLRLQSGARHTGIEIDEFIVEN